MEKRVANGGAFRLYWAVPRIVRFGGSNERGKDRIERFFRNYLRVRCSGSLFRGDSHLFSPADLSLTGPAAPFWSISRQKKVRVVLLLCD